MRALLTAALLFAALPAAAQPAPAPRSFVTEHRGTFHGRKIAYRATVAETVLTDAKNVPTASVFTTSYVASGGDVKRPVLFMFNGGPGSPSLWLHMGAFGPKRLPIPADPATPVPADAVLVDNPETVLDVADIVLIDPPGTGYSRILPGAAPRAFYSVAGDAGAVAEVMARWLAEHGRIESPRFLLGESYGTIRAVAVARALWKRPEPVALDGVVLMGQALNIIETSQRPTNIVSHMVALPGMTAIAYYHGRISREGRTLDQAIAESSAFAHGEYLTALAKGNRIAPEERDRIAARLESLTGVPAAYFVAHDLAILKEAFRGELLKDRKLALGRYDARYVAPFPEGGRMPDASEFTTAVYSARIVPYLKDALKVDLTEEYRTRDTDNRGGWDYGSPPSPFSEWPFVEQLAETMRAEPGMRLLLGSGIFDMTTTIGAAEHLQMHGGLPLERVRASRYIGGHMAYTDPETLVKFTGDVRAFILAAPDVAARK